MTRRAFVMALALLTGTASHAADMLEVRPGGVVRWPGDGSVTACQMAGERFEPVDGDCWFAIDLLTPEGGLDLGRVRDGVFESTTVHVGSYPYPVQKLEVAPRHVDLSEADAERSRLESERVATLWSLRTPRRFTLPLAPPLDPMPAARSFGNRRVFNGQPRGEHTGIDLSAATGTPVHAVADGTVVLAADHFFPGRAVYVDHGDGLVSMYFHLDTIAVADGDEVARGELLGTVGATGRVTGAHLHFGLRWRGARIDPGPMLGDPDVVPRVSPN